LRRAPEKIKESLRNYGWTGHHSCRVELNLIITMIRVAGAYVVTPPAPTLHQRLCIVPGLLSSCSPRRSESKCSARLRVIRWLICTVASRTRYITSRLASAHLHNFHPFQTVTMPIYTPSRFRAVPPSEKGSGSALSTKSAPRTVTKRRQTARYRISPDMSAWRKRSAIPHLPVSSDHGQS
jgi:hypothetical protein